MSQVVLDEQLRPREAATEQANRDETEENEALVMDADTRAPMERKCELLIRRFVFAIEEGFAAHVIVVSNLVRQVIFSHEIWALAD